jgi:hypothetical protein
MYLHFNFVAQEDYGVRFCENDTLVRCLATATEVFGGSQTSGKEGKGSEFCRRLLQCGLVDYIIVYPDNQFLQSYSRRTIEVDGRSFRRNESR